MTVSCDAPEGNDSRPEVRLLADASTRFLHDLVRGKRVTLTDEGRSRERYGRVLAYFHLDDRTLVNAEIISGAGPARGSAGPLDGVAHASPVPQHDRTQGAGRALPSDIGHSKRREIRGDERLSLLTGGTTSTGGLVPRTSTDTGPYCVGVAHS